MRKINKNLRKSAEKYTKIDRKYVKNSSKSSKIGYKINKEMKIY